MGFFKAIGLSGSSKSKSQRPVAATSIVQAELQENESIATAAPPSLESIDDPESLSLNLMRAEIDKMEPTLRALGDQTCDIIEKIVENTDSDWVVWEDKKNMKIEKNPNCLSKSICGRGTYTWTPPEEANYDFEFAANFLWDDKTKAEYDEFTEEMLVLVEYEEDYHVLNQVFKGRFGISGRDFVILCHKKRLDTDTHDRLIIAVTSVPKDLEPVIDKVIIDEVVREKHYKAQDRLVRGFAFAAGFCLTREKATNKFTVVYVVDADVKTQGVPQWIVNRVKLDQLKIVRDIPTCMDKAWKKNTATTATT